MNNILIHKVTIKDDCHYFDLSVNPSVNRTRQLAGFKKKLLEMLPGLKKHKCYNGRRHSFTKELENTELAHVLEHVIIELILGSDKIVKSVTGLTSWDWEKNADYTYEVKICYPDHHRINIALIESLAIIDGLIYETQQESPFKQVCFNKARSGLDKALVK